MKSDERPILPLWKRLLSMRQHARLGVAVSAIGLMAIGVPPAAQLVARPQILTGGLAALLIVAGVVLLRRPADEDLDESAGTDNGASLPTYSEAAGIPEHSSSVFTRRYWGWVALFCGVVAFLATPPSKAPAPPPQLVMRKKLPPPPPVATNEPVVPLPPPPQTEFPPLKLQGIHLHPSHPAAIINGKTYVAGDIVAGVSIVSVSPDSVMVERAGEKRLLVLASSLSR